MAEVTRPRKILCHLLPSVACLSMIEGSDAQRAPRQNSSHVTRHTSLLPSVACLLVGQRWMKSGVKPPHSKVGARGSYFAGRRSLRFRRRSAAVDGRKPCARRMASASFTVMRVSEDAVTGTRMMTGASMLEVEGMRLSSARFIVHSSRCGMVHDYPSRDLGASGSCTGKDMQRSPRDSGPREHTRPACGAVRPRAAQAVDCKRPPAGVPVATAEAAVVPVNP